jgi:hypothetical protein
MVQSLSGETKVGVTVGGETFLVDLAEPASGGAPEVTYDRIDFVTPDAGALYSTATLTPAFRGPPDGTVNWAVEIITNAPSSIWGRAATARHGLYWGIPSPNPGVDWDMYDIDANMPTGPVADLTDVVGSRTVRVTASTTVGGQPDIRVMTVVFGDGPLSVFNTTPPSNPMARFSNQMNASFIGTTDLPVVQACYGSIPNQPGQLTLSPPYFDPDYWDTGGTQGYVRSSNLPTTTQLLYIATFHNGYSPLVLRMGAARAANWNTTGPIGYWSGQISSNGTLFSAYGIDLKNGSSLNISLNSSSTNYACLKPL